MGKGYNESYYKNYDIGDKTVSYLESPELRAFLAGAARELTAAFQPKTVLDAGCAMGVLVSEFVKQGVDAWGLDLSDYAVTHTDPLAKGRCFQGSLAEPFPAQLPGRFDLVTCMEVVEHMSPEQGRAAIANLCAVTDTVVFCSTPDDFEDKTHINVQEREYWAACFAENGFFDDLSSRPLYLTDYAVCYRRRADWMEQVKQYERYIRETDGKLKDFRDSHYLALEAEHKKAVDEWTKTAETLRQVSAARQTLETERDEAVQALDRTAERLQTREEQYRTLKAEYDKTVEQWTALNQAYDRLRSDYEQSLRGQLEKDGEIRTVQAENEALLRKIAALQGAQERLSRDCSNLEKELERSRLREIDSKADLMSALKRADQAEADRAELMGQRDRLAQRNTQLQDAYDSAIHTYTETYNCLNTVSARVQALESSGSWRVMAPARWIKRRVKRLIGRSFRLLFRIAKKLRNLLRPQPETAEPALPAPSNWPPKIGRRTGTGETVDVHCRRLGIYTVYDRDGVVDAYILYYLKALRPWVEELLVVSNGPLNEDGLAALKDLGCRVLIRENASFDAWGVKTGLEEVGYETLAGFDEVVISNNTLFGPVTDLTPMFTEMSARKVDFWGITAHPGMEQDPFGCNPYGCIPAHIQSFFYVIRGNMLGSGAFRRFWQELPELPDYNAAVGLYETVMTRYFSEAGFVWDTYMDLEAYEGMTDNPLIAMPMESIRDWNSPFFKRRAFFQDYDYLTAFTGQQSASCLVQYLKEETEYPMDLVWRNLIRTCHMSDLVQNMHLSRIFDRENAFALDSGLPMPSSALFMHIYDHTMAPELAGYASSLPQEADVFISTVSEEKKAAIEKAFAALPNRVEIRVLPNRGRDVSALLSSFRDVVMNYDVACVTHDKKTGYLKPQTVGEGFAYMGYENILGGKTFVAQTLQAFARDPFLGLLYAPDPSHADFATHVGLEWGENFEATRALAEELKLHVPMDERHPAMAPYGSSFWFRTAAMKPLFDREWTYEDFPAEPFSATDGSILHAVERIYPYCAQQAGFYSALLMTADYAAVDIGNLCYYAQGYVHACFESGVASRFNAVLDICNLRLGPVDDTAPGASASPRGRLRRKLRRIRQMLTDWAYLM